MRRAIFEPHTTMLTDTTSFVVQADISESTTSISAGKFHKYAPFTLSTIIGRRNNVDLFCRFIIARHNKKQRNFPKFYLFLMRCRTGGSIRNRNTAGTCNSYRLPAKTHKPIASVAALTAQPLAALPPYGCGVPFTGSERHGGLQVVGHFRRTRRRSGLSF